jgi:hypothetical protein
MNNWYKIAKEVKKLDTLNRNDLLYNGIKNLCEKEEISFTGDKAWLTPNGYWINVKNHTDIFPKRASVSECFSEMEKRNWFRVVREHYCGGKYIYVDTNNGRQKITPIQNSAIKEASRQSNCMVIKNPDKWF